MDEIDPVAKSEAAAWHARLQSRAVSNSELDEFYHWRETPRNARAFDGIEALWWRAAELREDPDIERLVRGASSNRWTPRRLLDGFRFSRPLQSIGVLALSIIALMLAVTMFGTSGRSYRTGVGERLTVRLDDGSLVTLNTASTITVRLSRSERRVLLESGQAIFEVAHDARRPFKVVSEDATVTAIGTIFQVRRLETGTHVDLIRGKVLVEAANASRSILAKPGDTLEANGTRTAVGRGNPEIASSWLNGKIDLREVPLANAVAEVNRYTDRKIVLDVPVEGQSKVSGVFATGDPDAFAAALEAILPVERSERQDGRIHLVERR